MMASYKRPGIRIYLNAGCCHLFPRFFRLNRTLTQYQVIFGSIVFFFCLYYGGYHRLLLSASVVNSIGSSVDNRAKNEPPVDQPTINTNTKFRPPIRISYSSTCSLAADLRGLHQKVIGYSIYGDFSNDYVYLKYLKPFTETLRSIPIRYPGWIVRIYHNLKSDDVKSWRMLNQVLDLGIGREQHIDLCNVTEIIEERQFGDIFAMTWRWLPLLDDMVDILMSRDTDSPVFPREQDAVAEWLASNRTFHLMRDHPSHCRFFLGCCWGVKISQQRSEIAAQAEKMFRENHSHKYDYDQQLLDRFYQPMAVKSMIAHDSYCCEKVNFSSQPYPSARQNGMFVGWREVGSNSEKLTHPCPEKCRPQNLTGTLATADWSFC